MLPGAAKQHLTVAAKRASDLDLIAWNTETLLTWTFDLADQCMQSACITPFFVFHGESSR